MTDFNLQTLGTITALQTVVNALLKTHPDPQAVLSAIADEREPLTALWLGTPTPEAMLDSYDEALQALVQRLAPKS